MFFLTLLPYAVIVLFNAANGEDSQSRSFLSEDCGFIDREQVTTSKYARLYEFPWMALISGIARDGGHQFLCTGTVINQWYVITVAHCVIKSPASQVRVGDYDREQDVDCETQGSTTVCEDQFQDIEIDEAIIHEKYNANTQERQHDIALVRLKTPIDFSHKNAAPICLPITFDLRNKSLLAQDAVIAGWELMVNGQTTSKMLKLNVPIRTYYECEKGFIRDSNDNNTKVLGICTGGTEGVCPMESGSPLMIPTAVKEGVFRYVQYGIASHGTLGCGSEQWTIFTDVSKHMDWILNILKT